MTIGLRATAGLVVVLAVGAAACNDVTSGAGPTTSTAVADDGVEEATTRRYVEARGRTDVPVSGVVDVPLPAPRAAAAPVGQRPSLALGPLIETAPPSALADPPGPGPVLVATVEGQVLAVDLPSGPLEVAMDLRDRVQVGGEQGLIGMAVDPDGERIYVNYTDDRDDTVVRSWALDADGMPVDADGDGILHLVIGQPFDTHNGGNLVFGPDGVLWIGTGDGGGSGDPGGVAQDDRSLLGKILRVLPDPDGGVRTVSSNPDWDRPEIWAIGLRNPWRWSFDRETHRLWVADVGESDLEEVSVVPADDPRTNFGWDHVEGTRPFDGEPSDDFVEPSITYGRDDGCAVTGGYVYRGTANPGLYGWYVFSDFCGRWVRAVPADDPGADPMELISPVSSVVSFGELENGELVVLTAAGIQPLVAAPA